MALPNQVDVDPFLSDLLRPKLVSSRDLISDLFTFPNVYYIGSQSGCSCDFRYWGSTFGFQVPQEWASESGNDVSIQATRLLFDMITEIISGIKHVEVGAQWMSDGWTLSGVEDIGVSDLTRDKFYVYTDKVMRLVK